ncbi:hypothetical protein [Amycolatopsis nigrescens]|nr:hypothetical protein [Amycolatopsis nigrescens]
MRLTQTRVGSRLPEDLTMTVDVAFRTGAMGFLSLLHGAEALPN